ncbi:MAG: DNA recombination protein RmuC [Candidatus Gracilibacteria bacterium]|jgi:DNA recombination protein RmuC
MQIDFFSIVVVVGAVAGLIYFINKKFNALSAPQDENAMKLMMQVISELRRDIENGHGKNRAEMEGKLNQMTAMLQKQHTATTETVQKQLMQSAEIIQQVTKSLTGLQETNKQVVGFAEQMKSLESILKNPKQRGILGEYFLETLLSNVLPPDHFQMQYKMKNGEIVDAAVFYNKLVIPIDAKFSLEKYNQMTEENNKDKREELEKSFKSDVKKRIDETSKYIRPEEGTTEFAFMFIPAEGVYYSLMVAGVGSVNVENLMEYAFGKRVVIVSPSSFFAYLQTVIQGIKNVKAEESILEVLKNIEMLGKHVNAYDEYMQRLGKQIGSTVNTYNSASREFKKIDKDVYKITDGKVGGKVEVMMIEEGGREE